MKGNAIGNKNALIVCVPTDNQTIETRLYKNIILQSGRVQCYVLVEQVHVQVIWDVRLRKTDTSKGVAEESFKGALPLPFAETGGDYFYGPTHMEEFTLWLQSVIQ